MSKNRNDHSDPAGGSGSRRRNRGVMLDSMPGIAAATNLDELWLILWNTIRKMVPDAEELRIFRGDSAVVRETWSSDPTRSPISLILRGWGGDFAGMMQERSNVAAFLAMFGNTEQEAQARLQRFFTKQGNPLIVNDPDRQLAVFLSAEDVQKVRISRRGRPEPGQLILCPILVEGRIDLVAVVSAAPGEKPFSWDDAADVWQLVQLAREVSVRIGMEETVLRHLEEVKALRSVMRRISIASDVGELVNEVGKMSQKMLRASGALITGPGGREQAPYHLLWSSGIAERTARELGAELVGVLQKQTGRRELMAVESVGGGELFEGGRLQFENVEALAAVPLEVHGKMLGVLALLWPSPRRFLADERGVLEFLGAELSLAMDHHRLFQELTDSRAELREIVGAVSEGVVSLDAQGKVRYCNPRAVELLGIQAPAMEGAPLLDLLPKDQRKLVAPLLGMVLSGQAVSQRFLDMRTRRIQITVSLLGGEGHPAGSVWTLAELNKNVIGGAFVERVLHHLSEAVFVMDQAGRVLEANDALRRFYGTDLLSESETEGVVQYRWGEGLDSSLVERLIERGSFQVTGHTTARSGRLIPYEAAFWRMGEGDPFRVLAIVRDQTWEQERTRAVKEKREVQQLVRQGKRLLSELESGLSTQKDLVTSLLTQCELALARKTDAEKLLATVGMLGAAAERGRSGLAECSDLVENLGEILKAQGARVTAELSGTTRVWIVSDRPQRREHVLQVLASQGLHAMTIEGEELGQATEYAGFPDLVIVDLVSLNGVEEVYNRLRRIAPAVPLLVISAVGTLEGSTVVSEDPRLHVMRSLPTGLALEELLGSILLPE
ncbi:MAG: PAS domain-containing protein [Acidobacteria bacterium]|nr:PAS domain-containing protein [Acidobacteriota bacterium]